MSPPAPLSASAFPSEISAAYGGHWMVGGGAIPLDRPVVMGVLNVTPDSFSDGGRHLDPDVAVDRAARMVEEGADLIDVGGESTRPGARPVSAPEERGRVLPILRRLAANFSVPISIDTRKAEVARAALAEGAAVVNDVSALGDPRMGGVVAEAEAGLVLMHMRGTPETMQRDPWYADVVADVRDELREAVERAMAAGIAPERVVVDPGIGFGKTAAHNLELIARLDEIAQLGRPVLLGPSRKAFLGALVGAKPPEQRALATAAACVAGLLRGARIFRVHDVATVREALVVAEAIDRAGRREG